MNIWDIKKYDRSETSNNRNGNNHKEIITEQAPIDIEVARDREGRFEPQLVKKRQHRIDDLDQKIISLYAKGMSISDIRKQLEELYGADVSEGLISRVIEI